MELRSQTKRLCLAALFIAVPLFAQTIDLPVRHAHRFGSCTGALTIDSDGARFVQTGEKRKHDSFQWTWRQIQQLDLTRDRITVLSYRDRELLLGSDEPFNFHFTTTPDVAPLYDTLASYMDQRLSARIALAPVKPLWTISVKRLRKLNPVEGDLVIEDSRILFIATSSGESRVWRDSDIVNIASSSPFSLAITTYERDGDFDFQLRRALDAKQYDALWKRLNRPKGLELISTTKENSNQ